MPDSSYSRMIHRFIIDLRKPAIDRIQVVDGDTANQFIVTLKDNDSSVALSSTLHKVIAVFERADGEVYTQDAETGVSFTETGVVTIDLHTDSFRAGSNKLKIQIYKRENAQATTYPLLLTSYERKFTARMRAIPEAGSENAPAQLPMLEQLIADVTQAIQDCLLAAGEANLAWLQASAAATAADTAAENCNSKAEAAEYWAGQANTEAALAGQKAAAANDAAASANAAAAAALAAAKRNFYNIKHDTSTWTTNVTTGRVEYQSYAEDTVQELESIAQDALFASQVTLNNGTVVDVYERYRRNGAVYFVSNSVDGIYLTASMELGGVYPQITFVQHRVETPFEIYLQSGTWSESDGSLILSDGIVDKSASEIGFAFGRDMTLHLGLVDQVLGTMRIYTVPLVDYMRDTNLRFSFYTDNSEYRIYANIVVDDSVSINAEVTSSNV